MDQGVAEKDSRATGDANVTGVTRRALIAGGILLLVGLVSILGALAYMTRLFSYMRKVPPIHTLPSRRGQPAFQGPAAGDTPHTFRGPTGQPFMIGPTGPPPEN